MESIKNKTARLYFKVKSNLSVTYENIKILHHHKVDKADYFLMAIAWAYPALLLFFVKTGSNDVAEFVRKAMIFSLPLLLVRVSLISYTADRHIYKSLFTIVLCSLWVVKGIVNPNWFALDNMAEGLNPVAEVMVLMVLYYCLNLMKNFIKYQVKNGVQSAS